MSLYSSSAPTLVNLAPARATMADRPLAAAIGLRQASLSQTLSSRPWYRSFWRRDTYRGLEDLHTYLGTLPSKSSEKPQKRVRFCEEVHIEWVGGWGAGDWRVDNGSRWSDEELKEKTVIVMETIVEEEDEEAASWLPLKA